MLLKVTLSDLELSALDRMRGQTPRATWVRGLVKDAAVACGELERNRQPNGEIVAAPGILAVPDPPDEIPLPPRAQPRGGGRG